MTLPSMKLLTELRARKPERCSFCPHEGDAACESVRAVIIGRGDLDKLLNEIDRLRRLERHYVSRLG